MKLEGILTDTETVIHDRAPMEVIKDIAESMKASKRSPFYVFNIADVINKLRNWKILLPRVQPFYAMKCNNDPSLLKVLQNLGIGFDCASKNEIKTILEMNVDPSRIIFANPCKPVSQLRYAIANGVDLMTFDSDSDLYKVKDLTANVKLVLRIRCDALDAQAPLGIKYGAKPENAFGLLKTATKLNLSIVGVSFHVGSGCREPAVFSRAIAAAKKVFDQAFELGHSPYLLDIGGGYPGDSNSSLDECASYINPALEKHFPESMNVQIIAEPGRYVAASAFILATPVTYVTENKSAKGLSYMYTIDDGFYGSLNCVTYDHQIITPTLLKEPNTIEKFHSSILGQTGCLIIDKIMEDVYLPLLTEGDWIVWKDMGAYTLSAVSVDRSPPQVHPVIPYNSWLLLQKGVEIDSLLKDEQPLQ